MKIVALLDRPNARSFGGSFRHATAAYKLARLMVWVQPDSSLTRAAVYCTSNTEQAKQDRLACWCGVAPFLC